MKKLTKAILAMKIWRDKQGQDLIEYALMAGFVAVAAGALMPTVSTSISTVFSKISSVMAAAAAS
jgi:pilus assembly protein Flp/PilA